MFLCDFANTIKKALSQVRQSFSFILYVVLLIHTALFPYDFRSCKRRHQHVLIIKLFIPFCLFTVANVCILFEIPKKK